MHGILNIDKPKGITSYDVIRCLKKIRSDYRIGHAGTLDPIASGVLLVLINKATKIARFLGNYDKEYVATVHLGIETDTLDTTGKILRRHMVPLLDERQIRATLDSFCGMRVQVPPIFSALKQKGRRLYELARKGISVQPKPRQICIFDIQFLDFSVPFLKLRASVSKGTYIRSLVRDIGKSLGCGGALVELRRTRVGPFVIEKSTSLTSLSGKNISSLVCSVEDALVDLDTLIVDADSMKKILSGRSLEYRIEKLSSGYVKVMDNSKKALVIAKQRNNYLKPFRVIYNHGNL